jgi:hypothetical protein
MPGRVKCFVSGCSNLWYRKTISNKGTLSFHRLPKNTVLIDKYENTLKTKVPNAQNARVCGEHFSTL